MRMFLSPGDAIGEMQGAVVELGARSFAAEGARFHSSDTVGRGGA
jgi:hypothetical protein